MSTRMDKLQRQRALLQEHLRWLDSEIASEASIVPRPEPQPPTNPVSSHHAASPATERPTPLAAEGIEPDLPEANVRGIHNEVRSGCLLYFGIATAIGGLAIAYIYWRY